MAANNNPIGATIPWLVLLALFTAIYAGSNLYDWYSQGSLEYYSLRKDLASLNKKM
jgi:hypothetical protein